MLKLTAVQPPVVNSIHVGSKPVAEMISAMPSC